MKKAFSTLLLIALLSMTLSACRMFGARTTALATTAKLTAEEAEAAALAHAGLSREQVRFSRTEYEVDDGRPEYEIEFRAGNTEYDYTIHAETGQILSWDRDG